MGQKCEIPECEELLFGDSARESHMKIKHTKKYSCRYGQVNKKYNPLIRQNQSMLILHDEIAAFARRLSSRSSGWRPTSSSTGRMTRFSLVTSAPSSSSGWTTSNYTGGSTTRITRRRQRRRPSSVISAESTSNMNHTGKNIHNKVLRLTTIYLLKTAIFKACALNNNLRFFKMGAATFPYPPPMDGVFHGLSNCFYC